ncbi:MAG TPA: LysR family transcriptional regulator [Hyphomonadaceae bacterium]|nr:LysR family transcriptional regulator [Hyphomonadaceae bacterium]
MDRLDAMNVLIAAVEAGSLSAASRRLRSPLATVSRKVSDLEAYVGARLVTRTNRKLVLTDAGRGYIEAARRILEHVNEAERAAAGEYAAPRGDLTISAPVAFGRMHVLPVVETFLARHADINVRLLLLDRTVNMLEEHVDLAVRIAPLPDSNLIATRVGSIRHVVCASPAYLKQHGTPRSLDDLARHACITFDGLGPAKAWRFAERDIAVRPRLSVNTAEAVVQAAVSGVGLARVMSYQAADAVKTGKLKLLLRSHEPEPWPVSLIYPDQGMLPLKVRAFLDWAAPRLRKSLAV